MKIGILADTHDHLPRVEAAVAAFRSRGVEHVVHCGDFAAPFVLLRFSGKGFARLHGVLGNNDGEILMLKQLFASLGDLYKPPAFITVHGLRLAVLHEPMPADVMAALPVDAVCYGHTHNPDVQTTGRPLIINPGECCGYLTGRATVAVLDADTLHVELIDLP